MENKLEHDMVLLFSWWGEWEDSLILPLFLYQIRPGRKTQHRELQKKL